MPREHLYEIQITWTGNTGSGTSGYRDYGRNFDMTAAGKRPIAGSSDHAFRGDENRWNPEELLLGALSACHKLAYLHLCAVAGVVVTAYQDNATGTMESQTNGSGRFVRVVLHPSVRITKESDHAQAIALHDEAHAKCFIANSVNFPVHAEPHVSSE